MLRLQVTRGLVQCDGVDDLLYAKGSRLHVHNGGELRSGLQRESPYSQWTGHLKEEMTMTSVGRSC